MVQSNLVAIDVTPLSIAERSELQYHEAGMDLSEATYLSHLQVIHDKKLYREQGTFEEYCIARRGFTADYARKMLRASEVRSNLEIDTIVSILPTNEAQTRPLTRLDPKDQSFVWQRAVETAPNGKVTAAHIEQTVRQFQQPDTKPVVFDLPFEQVDDALDPPPDPIEIPLPTVSTMAVHFTSNTPEWYTPRHVIERVLHLFGEIDLDPCSNAKGESANVPAYYHYTAADDGLAQPWHGRVYMNPPYGDEISAWTSRLLQAYADQEIDEAIALLPARTDTVWFRPLMAHRCCFVHGRLKFSESKDSAPFPSVIVYLGPDRENFVEYFGDIGTIMQKYEA